MFPCGSRGKSHLLEILTFGRGLRSDLEEIVVRCTSVEPKATEIWLLDWPQGEGVTTHQTPAVDAPLL